MEFSCCFCALLTVKYGRFFTLVLFGHRDEKKLKNFTLKKGKISRLAQIGIFFDFFFFLIFGHNFLQIHPNVRSWGCFGKFRKFTAKWAQELRNVGDN